VYVVVRRSSRIIVNDGGSSSTERIYVLCTTSSRVNVEWITLTQEVERDGGNHGNSVVPPRPELADQRQMKED
jgi:hypothetical protein